MSFSFAFICVFALVAFTSAAIPFGQQQKGKISFYDTQGGFGACGSKIDAASQDLVAVSPQWFTNSNPNNDQLCKGVCVRVEYQGKSVQVPVKDKCPGCDKGHVDLSKKAFAKLANPKVGILNGVNWKFVRC